MTTKVCTKCLAPKPLTEFYKNRQNKSSGLRPECKPCTDKRLALYVATLDPMIHKERRRNATLKYEFGIEIAEYNALYDKQQGLCAICKRPQHQFKRKFAVDHNHTTGTIRGLLCASCNQGVGHWKDSVKLLESAIKYLKEYDY